MKNIFCLLALFSAGCAFSATPPRLSNWFTTNAPTETIGWSNTSAAGIRSERITTTNLVVSQHGTNYANQIAPASGSKLIVNAGINHGLSNNVLSTRSVALGGYFNFAAGVVIAGTENTNNNINDSVIMGGNYNLIDSGDNYSVILGGSYNVLNNGADNSAIICGVGNTNYAGDRCVIIGGSSNYIRGGDAVIIGGFYNSANNGVVIGYAQTNTSIGQVSIGNGLKNIIFDTTGVLVAGKSAISFIQTNGITGIQTNYTYFTNGMAFTNIAYPGWVAWP